MIIMGFCSGMLLASEQDGPGPGESIETMLNSLIDPFISQLPKKEPPPGEISANPPVRQPADQRLPPATPPPVRPSAKPPDAVPPVTVPKKEPPVDESKFSLTGIIYNTVKPQAIINGAVVGVGDRIDGAAVKAITKGAVEMKYQDTIFKLDMDQSESKPAVGQNVNTRPSHP
jgi:hypothetical protein